MRIFMTGATGYIGGAVALALRRDGHEVTAVVRPESDAGSLRDAGVVLVSGDLASLSGLRETIANHDAVVHTAFSMQDPVARDKAAIDLFTSVNIFLVF